MPPASRPLRGEVWLIDLNPVRGREQAGRRPALVLSADRFNRSRADRAVVVPITTRERRVPLHVRVDPPEAGLRRRSFILCEDIRSVSIERLHGAALGRVTTQTIAAVADRVRILLDL